MDEVRYTCPSCGEEIVTPVDISQGTEQEYVEDCPICCCPVILTVEFQDDGSVSCSANPE